MLKLFSSCVIAISVMANVSVAQSANLLPSDGTAAQHIKQSSSAKKVVVKKAKKITKAEIEADREARIIREKRDHQMNDPR